MDVFSNLASAGEARLGQALKKGFFSISLFIFCNQFFELFLHFRNVKFMWASTAFVGNAPILADYVHSVRHSVKASRDGVINIVH